MRSIQVFAHGKLRRNSHFLAIMDVIHRNFEVVNVDFSEYKGHMQELVHLFSGEKLLVAGGDGTFHEAVNGLMRSGLTPEIYLVPLGSGNDFSRSINLNAQSFIKNSDLSNWKIYETDVLKANFLGKNADNVKYSLNISDVGIGGEVAQWLHKFPDFLGVNLKYNIAVLLGFLKYKRKKFQVVCSERNFESKFLSICMGNGKFFANGMCICPHATNNDGKISISAFKNLSIFDYIKYLSKIKQGIKIEHLEVDYWLTEKISINSDNPCPIDMDGELGGFTPVNFEIIPKAIKLRIPN